MNLSSPRTIKDLLAKYDTKPSKGMGQNFLINPGVLAKIIEYADLKPHDTILEVGPGIGTLTKELAKRVKKVVTVEKDKKMVEILEETTKEYSNIEIINENILKFSISNYQLSNYKVVANIPYYLTSPLIRKLLESGRPPKELVLMVQKEVAQRICAKPPHMSLLAVSVQFYAEPKIISYIKKESFWPKPKVDSAIIKITPRNHAEFNTELRGKITTDQFFKIVKAGFAQPRKQLINNLTKYLRINKEAANQWLLENNIRPEQRAETLSVKDWQLLTRSFDGI